MNIAVKQIIILHIYWAAPFDLSVTPKPDNADDQDEDESSRD